METRVIFTISIITLLLLGSSLAVPGAFASKSPRDIEAHPPIHIKKFSGTSPSGYGPQTIWVAYGFNKLGCTHTTTTDWTDPNLCGHGQTIAIVDAYDDPNIASDLQTFDSQYGLPSCPAGSCFVKQEPQGTPNTNSGWALEISLDVEWAHSIAPGAKIILVEAKNSYLSSLLSAVDTAVGQGAQQVSMSWGGSEFSSESSYDYHFNSATASFFASSGDSGTGIIYPAASPYVVSVGGTTLNVDSSGNYVSETAWSGSGGGVSSYESKPSYQNNFQPYSGRAVPDVAYDGDPNTGVAVYDTVPYFGQSGWFQVGGTSAGAPQWAGISAIANSGTAKLASASFGTTNALYGAASGAESNPPTTPYITNYHDITIGSNGNCGSICNAGPGYDEVTGLGTPQSNNLIPYISPSPTPDFSISSSPSSVTVLQGGTSSSTITVTSLNGFNSAVTLAVTAPSGISGSVSPTSVTPTSGGSATSTLSITVPSTTATGTYSITVTGTSGSLTHSTSVSVTVTAPPPPDFSISASPSSLTINAGSSGTSTLTIYSLNGFSGTVSVTTSSPTALTATLNPSSITVSSGGSGSSTLSLAVASSATAGAYTVTVTGTSGSLTHSTSVTVNVQTVPSPPQNLQATAGNTQVTLSWQAPSNNGGSPIASYNVYRGTTAGGEGITPIATGVTSTSYTDTGLTNGQTYYYTVTAVNSVGQSAPSNEASAIPVTTPVLSVNVSTIGTYTQNSFVYITVTVTSNSNPVSGASVTLTVTDPTGGFSLDTGTTGTNGQVTFQYKIMPHAPLGTYTATAQASAIGYTSGSGSKTFQVT